MPYRDFFTISQLRHWVEHACIKCKHSLFCPFLDISSKGNYGNVSVNILAGYFKLFIGSQARISCRKHLQLSTKSLLLICLFMLATNIIMLWFPRTWPTHFGITRIKPGWIKGINITVSQVCAQAVLLKELSCLANLSCIMQHGLTLWPLGWPIQLAFKKWEQTFYINFGSQPGPWDVLMTIEPNTQHSLCVRQIVLH